MKFCQPHWDRLRAKIEERGLSHLIGKNGQVASERLAREVEGVADLSDWDPLMSAHFAIVNADLEVRGLASMDPQQEQCPLCACRASGLARTPPRVDLDENWLSGAADDARAFAIHHKLAAEAS